MRATIVIPTWNGREILRRNLPEVIASVRGTAGVEILVADDGSTDGTPEEIGRAFPGVRVVALPANGGFGAAANAGVAAARGAIAVCLNNDVRPQQGFLDPLLEAHARDDTLFAAAPRMIHEGFGGDEARTAGRFRRGLVDVVFPDRDRPVETRVPSPILYACGGAAAFRRDRFLQLGGFHAIFHPFYWEDVDLSWRARRRGWEVLHVPDALVHHEGGSTIGRRFARREVAATYERNRLLFIWSNLIDPALWRRHRAWIAPRVAGAIPRRGPFAAGLRRACGRWRDARDRRAAERRAAIVSDERILRAGAD